MVANGRVASKGLEQEQTRPFLLVHGLHRCHQNLGFYMLVAARAVEENDIFPLDL
jgi:hypothetical protein